jgi:hypothetical protein
VRSAAQGVVYGLARIDASGRICERAVITALGCGKPSLLATSTGAA